MPSLKPLMFAVALATLASPSSQAQSPTQPAPGSTAYAGEIQLRVDATDLDHKIMRVQQSLPVRPGLLQLHLPRWLPGTHSPSGDVSLLAGLKFSARGKALPWTRDPLDSYTFRVDVPAGTSSLDIEFQHLSPLARDGGRVVVTHDMLNVQWNAVLLYPAGHDARAISVRPTLVLPAGWAYGTALRANKEQAGVIEFKPISVETLVDSPLFAGRFVRRIELDPPGTPRPVVLTLVADRAALLKATEPQIEAHRELVRQADKLFASRHYAKYDFLLALTDEMSGIGLEHHESSEIGVRPDYFEDWAKRSGSRELLPHEYTHSWNGKFRRPQDLNTPTFNVPMQNSLLWVYEGQTQFWGWVLAARSGLTTPEQAREHLANTAANFEARAGRAWRPLQDTTEDAIFSRRREKSWLDWQRNSGDYYEESLLIWLDADTLIREKTAGAQSMDDFARAFFGMRDGDVGPLTYRFEDVVRSLNGVLPYDWAAFLRKHLDTTDNAGVTDGLARSGWKLAWSETPSESAKAREMEDKSTDFSWSLGLRVGHDGKVDGVMWASPAFKAGLAPGLTLVAVNNRAFKAPVLKDAIVASKESGAPIELLLRDGDNFRSARIDYQGGLRYPKLERVANTEDRLTPLHTRR